MKRPLPYLVVLLVLAAPAVLRAQFGYTTNVGGTTATITNYTGPGGAVTVPTNIAGLTVTDIGDGEDSVFAGTGATIVTIPDSVTNIEANACASSGLISVIISGSVTNLGDSAFENCYMLTNVYLNGNAPSADLSVFENDANATVYYLDGTTGWTITDSSTNFDGLPAMDSTPQDQFEYTTNDGSITITNYSGPCCGPVIIPDAINGLLVTIIGTNAFNSTTTGSSDVTIPSTVTAIEDSAFSGQGENILLNNVTIAYGVTSIGNDAFAGCSSMGGITLPGTLTNIGAGAFSQSGLFGPITIPSGVSSIGDYLFSDCMYLRSVILENGVTSIGEYAFVGCQDLGGVAIPNSVTNIGNNAFQGSGMGSVAIPGSVISIGDSAFNNTDLGGGVTIGNGVKNIGDGAFFYTDLRSITIPSSVTNIGSEAFSSCMDLYSITIENGVTSIGANAFFNCGNFGSIVIPSSVTNIGSGAFESDAGLASVYFTGNAPTADSTVFVDNADGVTATVYYLPDTTGWSSPFGGVAAVLWNPLIQASGPDFGVQSNQFGFNITGSTNFTVVVEACTNLASPVWTPLQTLTLTNGSIYFSDPHWTNYSNRYYGLGFP